MPRGVWVEWRSWKREGRRGREDSESSSSAACGGSRRGQAPMAVAESQTAVTQHDDVFIFTLFLSTCEFASAAAQLAAAHLSAAHRPVSTTASSPHNLTLLATRITATACCRQHSTSLSSAAALFSAQCALYTCSIERQAWLLTPPPQTRLRSARLRLLPLPSCTSSAHLPPLRLLHCHLLVPPATPLPPSTRSSPPTACTRTG